MYLPTIKRPLLEVKANVWLGRNNTLKSTLFCPAALHISLCVVVFFLIIIIFFIFPMSLCLLLIIIFVCNKILYVKCICYFSIQTLYNYTLRFTRVKSVTAVSPVNTFMMPSVLQMFTVIVNQNKRNKIVILLNQSKCILSACDITLIYSFSYITGKPGKILNRNYHREKTLFRL